MANLEYFLFVFFVLTGTVNSQFSTTCSDDSECQFDPRNNMCSQDGRCIDGCRSYYPFTTDCPRLGDPANYTRCNHQYSVGGSELGKCDYECRVDADCRLSPSDTFTRFCINNKCSECATKDHCTFNRGGPVCDLTLKKCVKCTTATQCSTHPTGSACIIDTGMCGCTTASNCVSKAYGNICNANIKMCGCTSNTNCKIKDRPVCNTEVGVCGNCTSFSDCSNNPIGQFCSPGTATPSAVCVAFILDCDYSSFGNAHIGDVCGCVTDDNCRYLPKTPACDCGIAKCVECSKDIHCKSWQRCNDKGKCVALKCTIDDDCYRNDLKRQNIKPTTSIDARCTDAGLCIEPVAKCVF